jgi:hypothetical protein
MPAIKPFSNLDFTLDSVTFFIRLLTGHTLIDELEFESEDEPELPFVRVNSLFW